MADITYQPETRYFRRNSMDWSAIWAGLFTFVAIWSVFGFLGFAIFASAASSSAGQSMSIGMGIWAVVLALVAMYIAGRVTGKLSGLDGRSEALAHAMVMFGLSLTAVMVLTSAGRLVFSQLLSGSGVLLRGANLPSFLGYSGWVAFFALFLGWLGAMAGTTTGVKPKTSSPNNVKDMRPAA